MLGRLIAEVGLEDAAELVGLATSEQLAQILEEDLWSESRPGQDPRFDSERFLVWLEIMLESGERFVAERLAELPPDLVTLALHRHVLVLPLGALQRELSAGDDDAEAAEKALSDCASEELDDYQLIWRGGDGWDSVLAALLALDRDHHDFTVELLERCAYLSQEHIEDNGGLYEVLTSEEMLESDLSAEREAKRAERGFVAPSAAAAFLRLALGGADETQFTAHDPLTRAYFRDLERKPTPAAPAPAPAPAPAARRSSLQGLLASAGLDDAPPRPRLLGAAGQRPQEPLVIRALRVLSATSPQLFAERSEELAYLSNALVAGATVDGRRLRPVEAVERAIECVSLGLALAAGGAPSAERAAELLATHPCDGLLRRAFAGARDASEPAAKKEDEALRRVKKFLSTLAV